MPVFENDLGRIEIAEDVIEIIAGLSAMECYGLVGMASTRVQEGLAELLGRENMSRGVKIKYDDDENMIIDLYIIVEYGVNIAEVAQNIIETVRYTVTDNTGLDVEKVNVNVSGVRVGT